MMGNAFLRKLGTVFLTAMLVGVFCLTGCDGKEDQAGQTTQAEPDNSSADVAPQREKDFFDREDLPVREFSSGIGYTGSYDKTSISLTESWAYFVDPSRKNHAALLSSLVHGDPRSLFALYQLHKWHGAELGKNFFDPAVIDASDAEETAKDAAALTVFFEKWTKEVWGDVYFDREVAKANHAHNNYKNLAEKDGRAVKPLLEKAMEAGDAEAMYYHSQWRLGEKKYKNLLDDPLLWKAAELGFSSAVGDIAKNLHKVKNKEECARRLELVERVVDLESPYIHEELANVYFTPAICVEKDEDKGFYYTIMSFMSLGQWRPENPSDEALNGFPRERYNEIYRKAEEDSVKLPRMLTMRQLDLATTRLEEKLPELRKEILAEFPWIKWSLLSDDDFNKARAEAYKKAGKEAPVAQ